MIFVIEMRLRFVLHKTTEARNDNTIVFRQQVFDTSYKIVHRAGWYFRM